MISNYSVLAANLIAAAITIFLFTTEYILPLLPDVAVIGSYVDDYGKDVLVFSLLVLLGTMYLRQVRRQRTWKRIGSLLDQVSCEHVEIAKDVHQLRINLSSSNVDRHIYKVMHENMALRLFTALQHSLNRVSRVFTLYTGRPCHACIKTYDPETDLVKTEIRDDISFENRRAIDERFPDGYRYAENTAFKKIIEDNTCGSFVSNYLRLSSIAGRYDNNNPEWRRHYGATLVVPITMAKTADMIGKDSVWGFICIDNKGCGFDRRVAVRLLRGIARTYHFILTAVAQLPPVEELSQRQPLQQNIGAGSGARQMTERGTT